MFLGIGAATWAALTSILQPLVTAFLTTFGDAVNDYLARTKADQNAKDLGSAQADLGAANDTISAQQAELQAQADAPKTVADAISKLEDGSA